MARKVRKQIYIEAYQEEALKRQAAETGMSEAEIIRRAIDNQTRLLRHPVGALEAWEEEMAFIREWMAKGPVEGGRTWRREDLYDR
jgi:hypothetical protein